MTRREKFVVLFLILIAICVRSCAHAGDDTPREYTVYDNSWQVKAHVRNGVIYDKNWNTTGHIRDNTIYDSKWKRVDTVKGVGKTSTKGGKK
jgi:hypothetical protein